LHAARDPDPGIDSDHLLLGVLRLDGPLTSLFADRGVTLDTVRALVANQRYDPPPSFSSASSTDPQLAVSRSRTARVWRGVRSAHRPTRLSPESKAARAAPTTSGRSKLTDLVSACLKSAARDHADRSKRPPIYRCRFPYLASSWTRRSIDARDTTSRCTVTT
jgi:hypothetical protein